MRAMAQRCRELSQIAVNPEVKAQLIEWIGDFEEEAETIEAETEGKS